MYVAITGGQGAAAYGEAPGGGGALGAGSAQGLRGQELVPFPPCRQRSLTVPRAGGIQAATPCPQCGLQGLCTLVSVQSCGQPGPRGPGKQCCSRVLPGAPGKPDTSSRLQPHPGRPRREGSACPQGSTEGAAALPNRASGRHGNHALKSEPLCPRGICHGKGGSEGPNPSGVCAGVPVLAAVITGSAWPRSHGLVPHPHW